MLGLHLIQSAMVDFGTAAAGYANPSGTALPSPFRDESIDWIEISVPGQTVPGLTLTVTESGQTVTRMGGFAIDAIALAGSVWIDVRNRGDRNVKLLASGDAMTVQIKGWRGTR